MLNLREFLFASNNHVSFFEVEDCSHCVPSLFVTVALGAMPEADEPFLFRIPGSERRKLGIFKPRRALPVLNYFNCVQVEISDLSTVEVIGTVIAQMSRVKNGYPPCVLNTKSELLC